MLVFRCTNGVVLFRIGTLHSQDSIAWRCLNDQEYGVQPRTDAGIIQLTQDIAQHAQQLRGAIQQFGDFSEIA